MVIHQPSCGVRIRHEKNFSEPYELVRPVIQSVLQVNTRFLAHELTGVQRYTTEVLRRMNLSVRRVRPDQWPAEGVKGHLWEQFALPFLLNDGLLWNPTCPGPVAVRNQVVTVHDLTAIDRPEWFDTKYALWHRVLTPLALHRCRHIIAVSKYTSARIQDRYGISDEKISVIHNGVDPRFQPSPADKVAQMRQRLDLPEGPYVLSLSAIEPRKNIHRILRVWNRVQGSLPRPMHLVLAGGAGRPTIFHDYSIDDVPDNVHFTGYVDDELLPDLYSGADAFIYPSLYEGFGLPVVEAMACGTAVVTSNTTSLPEVAGDAAVRVDPTSDDDLYDGFIEVLTDTTARQQYEKKGQERAATFRWDKTAQKTENILRRFIGG